MQQPANDTLWIFGYGSLIWRPEFPFEEKLTGYIVGWKRRFWQGSPEHRGTPEELGRVVSLFQGDETDDESQPAPAEAAKTWGVVYRIADDKRQEVLAYLDDREKAGYGHAKTEVFCPFQPERKEPIVALVYMATSDNPTYLGPQPYRDMALQIHKAAGMSGKNADYLLRLVDALRALAEDAGTHPESFLDRHVKQLEAMLRLLSSESASIEKSEESSLQHDAAIASAAHCRTHDSVGSQ